MYSTLCTVGRQSKASGRMKAVLIQPDVTQAHSERVTQNINLHKTNFAPILGPHVQSN